jgi:hypothetical protein
MTVEDKIQYLQQRLEEQIEAFNNGRRKNKKKAFRFRLSVILCSAFTTILIGLQSFGSSLEPIIKDAALIFSAMVTALSAIDAFYNHRALWIRYTATSNDLKTVQSKLQYLLAGNRENVEENRIDELFEEFHRILNETNEYWLQLRKENEKQALTSQST